MAETSDRFRLLRGNPLAFVDETNGEIYHADSMVEAARISDLLNTLNSALHNCCRRDPGEHSDNSEEHF